MEKTRPVEVEIEERYANDPPRYLTLDVLREKHTYFVLDSALRDFASEQRSQAEFERANDPEDTTAASRIEWAEAAERLLDRIDAALSNTTGEVQP